MKMRVVRMKAGAQEGVHEQREDLGVSERLREDFSCVILAVLCPAEAL